MWEKMPEWIQVLKEYYDEEYSKKDEGGMQDE